MCFCRSLIIEKPNKETKEMQTKTNKKREQRKFKIENGKWKKNV